MTEYEVTSEEELELEELEQEADEFDDFYLDEEDNLFLQLCDARIKNSELSRRLKEAEYKIQETRNNFSLYQLRAQTDTISTQLRNEKDRVRQEMEAKRAEVEERFGIKLSDYSFDPETGRLTKLPDD